jgi:IS4 transposase
MPPQSRVFSQVLSTLFAAEFSRCSQEFPTARITRSLSEFDHFLALSFGQLTRRESLRDIVCCLQSKARLLYHLGFRGRVTRTNLAYASKHRDWRLFAAVAEVLMRRAARLYSEPSSTGELRQVCFALDSSIIRLSLNLFPWGYWGRSKQAALKLHLLLSLQGNVPAWAAITEATFPDMKVLDQIPIEAGAFYILDRGYLDFVRLYRMAQAGGFFVVRSKRHVKFSILQSRAVDKAKHLWSDQTVRLTSNWSIKSFPQPLRRVSVYDPEHKVHLVLLTNNFLLKAEDVGELYRRRWQVELFFKWIKQHLKIRAFYGRSENAVRSQVWVAIATYLLVAIIKKELKLQKSLNEILQVLSVSAFEEVPLAELLAESPPEQLKSDIQKPLLFNDL